MRNSNTLDLVSRIMETSICICTQLNIKLLLINTSTAFSAFPSNLYRLLRVRGILSNVASTFMALSRVIGGLLVIQYWRKLLYILAVDYIIHHLAAIVLGFLDKISDYSCEIVSRYISYPINNAMHSQIKRKEL